MAYYITSPYASSASMNPSIRFDLHLIADNHIRSSILSFPFQRIVAYHHIVDVSAVWVINIRKDIALPAFQNSNHLRVKQFLHTKFAKFCSIFKWTEHNVQMHLNSVYIHQDPECMRLRSHLHQLKVKSLQFHFSTNVVILWLALSLFYYPFPIFSLSPSSSLYLHLGKLKEPLKFH